MQPFPDLYATTSITTLCHTYLLSVCVSQNTKGQSFDPSCNLCATCAVRSKIYNVYHDYYFCCIKLFVLYQKTPTTSKYFDFFY